MDSTVKPKIDKPKQPFPRQLILMKLAEYRNFTPSQIEQIIHKLVFIHQANDFPIKKQSLLAYAIGFVCSLYGWSDAVNFYFSQVTPRKFKECLKNPMFK